MKTFFLLLLLVLVMGEVSGGLQIGAAQAATLPQPPAENGQLIFATIVAIIVVVAIIFIQQYKR